MLTPPQFSDIQTAIIADITNNLIITNPTTGQRIAPNFSVGSVLLTFSDVLALVMDAFYNQLVNVDLSLRLATAQGQDLDDLVALLGVTRQTGLKATVPVLFWRDTATGSSVDIPTGLRVLGRDQFGNATIEYETSQDFTLALRLAGQIPAGANGGWVLAQCTQTGVIGNIGAGQIAQMGDTLAGVNSVSNPQLSDPPAPTVTNDGSGAVTRKFALVAHGLTGTTNIGAVGQTTTSKSSPNDTLSWTPPQYAVSVDVLIDVSDTDTPLYQLLANVPAAQTSFTYTGQTPAIYAAPTGNTSNTGVGGVDDETDDKLRKRAPTVLQQAATSSNPALLAAVSSVSGVTRVFGEDDTTPGIFDLYYTGVSNPLPDNIVSLITAAIKTTKAAGIQVLSTQVSTTPVDINYSFVPASGTDGSTLISAINAAISDYLDTLTLGQPVYNSQVQKAILDTDSRIVKATVTSMKASGTTYNTPNDVPGVDTVIYGLGLISSTIASS